jgi:hypothetical protein
VLSKKSQGPGDKEKLRNNGTKEKGQCHATVTLKSETFKKDKLE